MESGENGSGSVAAAQSPNSAPQSAATGPAMNESNASAELLGLIAEIQNLGNLDPATKQSLMNDLKHSDPALWPQLVRQFRATLAYSKQAGQSPTTSVNANGIADAAAERAPIPEFEVPASQNDNAANDAPVAKLSGTVRSAKTARCGSR